MTALITRSGSQRAGISCRSCLLFCILGDSIRTRLRFCSRGEMTSFFPFQEAWCFRRITSGLVLRISSWLKMLFKLGFVGVLSDTTSGTRDDPVARHVGFALLCFAELLIASEGLWFPLWSLRCHNADRINPEAKESGSGNCCCCDLSLVNTMLPQAGAFRVIKNELHLSNVKCHVEQSV